MPPLRAGQGPAGHWDDTVYDAVIIGGGPAGSTAAALLAQQGHRVLLLEKECFPRFHVGESLLPYNMRMWKRLGVMDEMERRYIRKEGAVFIATEDGAVNRFRFADGLDGDVNYAFQVPRADFDELLLRNAARLGAEVREQWRVVDTVDEGGRLVGVRAQPTQGGPVEEFRGRIVLDASGQQTFLGSRRGLKVPDPRHRKVACFWHWQGAIRDPGPQEGNILIASCPKAGGWIWFIPFKGDTTSIGVVMDSEYFRTRGDRDLSEFAQETLFSVEPIARRLQGARRTTEVHTLANFSYRCKEYCGPGWAMIGDAAAFLDPVFSSGVHLAMSSAAEAADATHAALAAGRLPAPRDFRRFVSRSRRGLQVFTRFIHGWYDPSFRFVFMRPPAGDSRIKRVVTAVLAGEVSRRFAMTFWLTAFFSLIGYLRRRRERGLPQPEWFRNEPPERVTP